MCVQTARNHRVRQMAVVVLKVPANIPMAPLLSTAAILATIWLDTHQSNAWVTASGLPTHQRALRQRRHVWSLCVPSMPLAIRKELPLTSSAQLVATVATGATIWLEIRRSNVWMAGGGRPTHQSVEQSQSHVVCLPAPIMPSVVHSAFPATLEPLFTIVTQTTIRSESRTSDVCIAVVGRPNHHGAGAVTRRLRSITEREVVFFFALVYAMFCWVSELNSGEPNLRFDVLNFRFVLYVLFWCATACTCLLAFLDFCHFL